eukprot:jgi/Hompol1/6229/HPOL_001340-RA
MIPGTHGQVHPNRPVVQKQQTGHSKNCLSFVEYDPKIDDVEHQKMGSEAILSLTKCSTAVALGNHRFSKDTFKTSHSLSYKYPAKPSNAAFAKTEFVAQEILDSGFTRLPKHRVTDQGRHYELGISEMKQKFLPTEHILRDPAVDRSHIAESSSAYTSDKPPSAPLRPPQGERIKVFPVRLDHDGFTTSEKGNILASKTNPPGILPHRSLEHIKNSDPTRWIMMHDNGQSTSTYIHHELHPMEETMKLRREPIRIGPKQDAGSIRNNRSFWETKEPDPRGRFTTETSERFVAPKQTFESKTIAHCIGVNRSGFTSSNKYQYTFPVKDRNEF